ncbi:uncharacterized protein BDV14DRAFT_177660 [Aspergillus stella-maris]|uniref:uncharacterized protein n=1 Tax=Aspergillus stella-maris TaxID=1810926 RepID=UPI003CCC935D
MRRLPQSITSAASPARLFLSCSPATTASNLRLQSPLRSATNYTPSFTPSITTQIPRRYLSYTLTNCTPNQNSPFRLSSENKHQPAPETEPEFPFEHTPSEGGYYSPYKPKRQWPPDMSKLSPKHQFRLERKYRRRAALKYARPKWVKATKLVQWGAIGFVLIYALLFMEWDERGGKPIEELRTYIFGSIKGAFSAPPSQASMRRPSEEATKE